MEEIDFSQWQKLDLRVGKVISVEKIPNKDKLYKLKVNVGLEHPIQIIAGIAMFCKEEEVLNKNIIVLVNLKPIKLAGEISEGMMLCAEHKPSGKESLLITDRDIDAGAAVV